MRSVPVPSALALGVALAFSLPVSATTTQPEVVVTATRAATTVDASLASVTLITRAQIEASGTLDLLDLLRAVPGLDIVRGGGQGQQTSVFLRGTNSNHVLVLIDGVRVAALGAGAFAWEQLALAQVERIEIVRGPRAALWGSDAIGGVIQVFTRRGEGFDAVLGAGNHDTFSADAGAGWRDARGGVELRLGFTDAGGINAQNPEGFNFDPDDDGFTHRNALLRADLALGEQRLEASAVRRDNDIEFDRGESETRQSQVALVLEGALAPDWTQRAALAAVRDTLSTPAFFSRYDSRREQADWTHELARGDATRLLFGLGYVRERGTSLDTFSDQAIYRARRSNRAGFASASHDFEAHRFELSARRDDNSQFGGETTFSAAWGWQATDVLRASANWGEGFRAPTLNELYSPGFGGLFAGNPGLDPEHSRSAELGLDLTPDGAWRLGLRAYRNTVRDLVEFSGGTSFQAINLSRVRIDGVEADWRWQRGDWSANANATWQDARNEADGAALLRRPDRKGNIGIERGFANAARLGIEAHVASSRPEFGGDLPGYGVLNLHGSLPLGRALRLDGRIENLLDRDYVLARGFNTPGLTAMLTLRWNP